MTNTYLVEIIQALRPEEQEEVIVFLKSPFFAQASTGKDVLTLYLTLLKAAPSFSAADLDKETIYHQVFQEKEMVRGKLEKLMSELTKLLKQYVLWGRYNSDAYKLENQINWASWLRERGLGKRFQQTIPKIKNKEKENAQESLKTYHTALKIAEEEHEWESKNNLFKNDLNLPNLIYSLDAYYFNYRTELINRFLLQQKAAQLPDMEWMVASIEEHQKTSLLLNVAQKIQLFLEKNNPLIEELDDILNALRENEKMFPFQLNHQLYAYLRSFCGALINDGHLELVSILHRIHRENLSAGYLFLDDMVPVNSYLNLVQIATRAGSHEWAREFTENYKDKIIGGDEDGAFYHLNVATCLFSAGKWEEALAHLPQIPSASHYHMMVRLLELKIYYEMRSDMLDFKIFAFRKYIERTAPKAISAKLREMNLNFLNMLIQITQSPPKDKKRSDRLVARIQDKKAISERGWLIEKAKELG